MLDFMTDSKVGSSRSMEPKAWPTPPLVAVGLDYDWEGARKATVRTGIGTEEQVFFSWLRSGGFMAKLGSWLSR